MYITISMNLSVSCIAYKNLLGMKILILNQIRTQCIKLNTLTIL